MTRRPVLPALGRGLFVGMLGAMGVFAGCGSSADPNAHARQGITEDQTDEALCAIAPDGNRPAHCADQDGAKEICERVRLEGPCRHADLLRNALHGAMRGLGLDLQEAELEEACNDGEKTFRAIVGVGCALQGEDGQTPGGHPVPPEPCQQLDITGGCVAEAEIDELKERASALCEGANLSLFDMKVDRCQEGGVQATALCCVAPPQEQPRPPVPCERVEVPGWNACARGPGQEPPMPYDIFKMLAHEQCRGMGLELTDLQQAPCDGGETLGLAVCCASAGEPPPPPPCWPGKPCEDPSCLDRTGQIDRNGQRPF